MFILSCFAFWFLLYILNRIKKTHTSFTFWGEKKNEAQFTLFGFLSRRRRTGNHHSRRQCSTDARNARSAHDILEVKRDHVDKLDEGADKLDLWSTTRLTGSTHYVSEVKWDTRRKRN